MVGGQRARVILDCPTIQDNIYATLRNEICMLELAPGAIMSANEIALSMTLLMHRSVSRTPVREAFIRLAKEGLVLTLPQHGTIVTKINPKRAREERNLRYTLEKEILEDLHRNIRAEDYKELYEIVEKQEKAIGSGNRIQYIELDNDFHHKQYKISGHPLYLDIVMTFNSHYERLRNLTTWDVGNVRNSICQHRELLRCLERGALGQVKEVLKNHLCKLDEEEGALLSTYPDYFDIN